MKYRPDIDGLRGLAVLPVVLYHAGIPGFSGGYLGVDVFFVISGYLIASIIIAEAAAGSFSLLRFYERRARRILPALTLVSTACVPFAWAWMPPDQFAEFSDSLLAVSLFVSNFLFWKESGYFAAPNETKPLIHTWSLAIEEQFYIIFPLLLLLIWKYRRDWLPACLMAIAVVSLAYAEWAADRTPTANFYLLPSRAWELATGALLAVLEQRRGEFGRLRISEPAALCGLVLVLGSIALFDEDARHPGIVTLTPVIGTALLIRFAGHDRVVSRILSSRPLLWTGLISYSLYLWHLSLFAFARTYSINTPGVIDYLWLIAAAILLSVLSWRFVERPFRNRAVVPARRIWELSGAALVLLASVGAYGHVSLGAPWRFPELESLMRLVEKKRQRPARGPQHAQRASIFTPCSKQARNDCIIGDASVPLSYALVGDSHAIMLWKSVDRILKQRNQSAFFMHRAGCPYANGLKRLDRRSRCDSGSAWVRKRLASQKISTVILAGRYVLQMERSRFDNGEGGREPRGLEGYFPVDIKSARMDELTRRRAVADRYRETIQDLLKIGKRVILVYPVPEVGWHVPHTLFKLRRAGKTELSTSFDVYLARSRATLEAFDSLGEHPNLVRVKPSGLFCDTYLPRRCATHTGMEVFYKDTHHLSQAGARMVVRAIFAAADAKWGPD